mmetsp:Transcript_24113/g.75871  ORF Transcript_24113/g.75871 Transcript_24113/m.75871 type:complete len:144 (-) Transcript_24113:110-541(-)
MGIPILFIVRDDPELSYVLKGCLIWVNDMSLLVIIFGPPFYKAFTGEELDVRMILVNMRQKEQLRLAGTNSASAAGRGGRRASKLRVHIDRAAGAKHGSARVHHHTHHIHHRGSAHQSAGLSPQDRVSDAKLGPSYLKPNPDP